jgi:hypothetical protein
MASTEITFDHVSMEHKIIITLNHRADDIVLGSIHEALEAAGKKFVEEQGEKILAELKTENIEKYVAEYVAKNLILTLKEKDDA